MAEGAKMVEGTGMTSTSSSLGLASIRGATLTRGMPNLVTAAGALTDGPKVFDLLLMAFFFLSPSRMCLFSMATQIASSTPASWLQQNKSQHRFK